MILSICSEPKILEIMRIVNIFINIIQIVVPILLIFTLIFKFIKATINDDQDNLQKVLKTVPSNLIAAVIIFLVPYLVSMVVKVSFPNDDYKNCLNVKTVEQLNKIYEDRIEKLISKAEETLNINDYTNAINYLKNIKDEDLRKTYENKLNVLKEQIENSRLVYENDCDYGNAACERESTPTGSNPNADILAKCVGEYENGYGIARLNVNVSKGIAINYKFLIDGKTVKSSTNNNFIADSEYTILINPKVIIQSNNGQSTTIKCSTKHSDYFKYNDKGYYFSSNQSKDKTGIIDNPYSANSMPYYIHIPKDISSNEKLPLIIGLHGGYGIGNCENVNGKVFEITENIQTNHYFKTVYYTGKNAINGGKDNGLKAFILTLSNNKCSWNDNMYGAMDIIHAIIKLYNIDLGRIYLTGVSQGGAGTLYLGFLEEQILYKAKNNDTTLSSIAEKYNTTVNEIKAYNRATGHTIYYSDGANTKLKNGSTTIIRSRSNNEPGSIFALLMPFSPAHDDYRYGFVNVNGYGTPPHVLKTPIWVITSNDEYAKVQQMANEITKTYDKLGDVRYTVLTKLNNPHDTDTEFFNRTNAAKWLISNIRGKITVNNNQEIDAIESQMGVNFACVLKP